MGALVSFGLPTMEIASGKEPVAIIFTSSRRLLIRRMKVLDNARYFILKDGKASGIYELDSNKMWLYEKVPCFFYDLRNAKPLDPPICNELHKFAEKNKLSLIKRKDVKHGSMLRILRAKHGENGDAQKKLEEHTAQAQVTIDQSIEAFGTMANQAREKAMKEKKEPDMKTEYDYGFNLIRYLMADNLLTEEEGMLLEERLRTNNLTLTDLIDDLRTKEAVAIHEPITVDAERFLNDFHTYDPARVSAFVDTLRKIDKQLKTMTSIPVKNWIPASLVLAISIGLIIGVMVLIQNWPMISKQLSGIMPGGLPSIPETHHFILGVKAFFMSKFF